ARLKGTKITTGRSKTMPAMGIHLVRLFMSNLRGHSGRLVPGLPIVKGFEASRPRRPNSRRESTYWFQEGVAMKSSSRASALSALILVFTNGRAAGQAKSPNDMAESVSKPVVYQVEGMDRVRVRKDVVYKKDGAVELKMDISTPEKQKPGESLPVVFFIHGGVPRDVPVLPKDWGIYRSWGRLIAASGMAAVTFNHRVGYPDPNLAQGAADLADGSAFVRGRAADFGIDPERIALAAYSA